LSKVAIKENVLRWALDRSNTPVAAMRDRFPKILEWLEGTSQPTLKQLESFARATTTPLGMLFLDEPPEEKLEIPYFRTITNQTVSRPSADLLDTIYTMQSRQDWMRDYLKDEGQPPLPFVRSATLADRAEDVAKNIRDVLGLGEMWAARHATWEEALQTIRDAMERVGILVFANGIVGNNTHRTLNPEEFRGFVLIDDYAPLIFVNAADAKVAQMFTQAHELVHIFYGISAVFDLGQMMPATDQIEQACNEVAAEFLVPKTHIQEAWPSVQNEDHRFYQLARQFKVSTVVVARRLYDLGLIGREEFLKFYYARIKDEQSKKKPMGGDFYNLQPLRVGKRFGAAVVRAARERRMTYTEAYSLTGLRGGTFDAYAASVEK